MLLSVPELSIYSYSVTNSSITLIGEVNDASYVSFSKRFAGYGRLSLTVRLTDENVELCKVGNMLCMGSTGKYCYFITSIEPQKDENGFITIKVSGRGLEDLLYKRILYPTFKYENKVLSYIMYNLVDANFINTGSGFERRILPHLVLENGAYSQNIGPTVTLQRVGKSVKDRLDEFSEDYDVGYEIYFDVARYKFVFVVLEHRDMSYGNNVHAPVIFDTETDDILESTYSYNVEAERNIALIVGEVQEDANGNNKVRAKVVVGDDTLTGYDRKELYIDARDLQSESENDSGSIDKMSDAEYEELLRSRGAVKLSENAIAQTLEASVRYYGSMYEFDKDYMVGDKVTFIDRDVGAVVNAYISEVEHVYADGYELRLTVGTGVPTLFSKIKAMM